MLFASIKKKSHREGTLYEESSTHAYKWGWGIGETCRFGSIDAGTLQTLGADQNENWIEESLDR